MNKDGVSDLPPFKFREVGALFLFWWGEDGGGVWRRRGMREGDMNKDGGQWSTTFKFREVGVISLQ